MEKVSSIKRRKINQNFYENQYSFLNRQPQIHDKLNCLSVDLERLRKNNTTLPSITSERKNLINAVSEKLRLLKQKIMEKDQQRQKAMVEIEAIHPFPINYSVQMPIPLAMQQPQYPFPNPPFNMSCCHQCNHKQPKKHRKKPKKQKKEELEVKETKVKRKNRFRIYGYAVYFSIFIKYYTQRFTQNRKKWFMDRYSRKQRGIIYEGSEKVLRKLQDIDFYQMSQQAKSTKHISGQTIIDWQEYTKTALVPAATLSKSDKSRDTVSQYIINFTDLLMGKLAELVLDDDFIQEYHEVFSAGSLDMNFMIDNLYLPEQIPFLFIHPSKGYLRLGYKQQIQLLLIKVMIKMVIFNFLLGLAKSKTWCKKQESLHKLAQFQIEEMWQIGRTLAIYLYIICKDLYLTGVKNLNHQSNFYELCKRFGIKQAKHLEESTVAEDLEDESKEKKFQLIRNIKNYRITAQKINKNHRLNEYKSVLKEKIVDLLANLHEKLKKQERDLYAYVKNMTLAVPYLILQGMKSKEQLEKKRNQHYKILNPNQKSGKVWNEIYRGVNNSHSSEKSKSKQKNVKFNDSQDDSRRQRSTVGADSKREDKSGEKIGKYSNQNKQNLNPSQNTKFNRKDGLIKAELSKKPFNFDTVNGKSDENRQERIRQKFRNLLLKNEHSQ